MSVSPPPLPVNPESATAAKEKLRIQLRDERSRFARAGHAAAASQRICAEIESVAAPWESLAAFIPYGDEPAILPALTRLHEAGKRILLPKLGPGLARTWAWFSGPEDLLEQAPNRPPVPTGPTLQTEAIAAVDGILLPALAIDQDGYRLGQGAGWYDRALGCVSATTPLIAVIFDHQFVDLPLPAQDHDRRVTALISEQGLLKF